MLEDQRAACVRLARRTLDFPFGHWYWGDAIAIDGLLAVGGLIEVGAADRVAELLVRWLERVPVGYHDALAPGAAIAALVGQGTLPTRAVDRFLEALDSLPILYAEVPALEPHLPQFRFGLCIDAVYHLPPALAAIGRLRSDRELVRRAGRMVHQMLERLRCPGSWAHWYELGHARNNAVPWSRGVGWALLGALDTAALTEDPTERERLHDLADEIWAAMLAGRGPTGWGPVLGRSDLPEEASVAAFMVAAAHHPVLPMPDGGAALADARVRVMDGIDPGGAYLGVSADVLPQWDPATYQTFRTEVSPWGQGVALRALAGTLGPGITAGSALPPS